MMKKSLFALAVALAVANPLFAQEAKPTPPAREFKPILDKIDLKDGDTLVFLGDSITHQCLYTQYVEDFFYTRYPNLRLRFHNAGVGGDRASDALLRFDDDVAAFKPKYVTILLGMNDGTYTKFEQTVFDTYERDMTKLLDQIAALGAKAVPMTPTMFDSRAVFLNPKKPVSELREKYYNGVLSFYGAWLREQALLRGLGYVDMWGPLNNLTLEQRKKDPKFTLIADAVHPGPDGQVVMAVAILNDMVPRGLVSSIVVQEDKAGKWQATAANGKVTDFQGGDKVSFTFKANALPWVLPPDATNGYKLTAAGHRNSNEKITVRNLKPGRYELRIDGQAVGTFADGQLAFGVELEGNSKTPQYQQALKVALLNKERNDKAMHPLRDLWRDLKVKRNALQKLSQDPKQKEKAAAAKEAFDQWLGEFKSNVAKRVADVKQFDDQIYQANQPVARKYELSRVP